MARKKRRSKPAVQPPAAGSIRGSRESRSTEALTVGWMLTVMTTLLCQIGSAAVRIYLHWQPDTLPRLELLSVVLIFAGLVLGVVTLVLLPIVYRMRRDPPPWGIVVFAAVVGVVPVLMAIVRAVEP